MNAITQNESALISQNLKTTSLVVAEKFGKLHKDVLRTIKSLELPEEFNGRNFALVEYLDAKGEKRPFYEMTRDGFSLLVMGFTGKKAMEWKIRFLEAFNAMEKQLTSPATAALPPIPKLTSAQMVEIQKQMFLRFPDGPRRAQAYIALKEHFGVARYYEIEESRFDEAVAFIQSAPLCCSPEKALDRLIDYIDTRLLDGCTMAAVHEESAHLLEIAKILRGDIRGKFPPEHRRELQTGRKAAA